MRTYTVFRRRRADLRGITLLTYLGVRYKISVRKPVFLTIVLGYLGIVRILPESSGYRAKPTA